MEEYQKTQNDTESDDVIQIQDLLYLCLSKWKWFVLSVAVAIGIAFAYIVTTPKVYTRSASVLIKDDAKNGSSLSASLEQSFADMGMFKSNTNVNNEVICMQSPSLMYEVVKRIHLDMNYMVDNTFRKNTIYGTTLPVSVSILDFPENDAASFVLKIDSSRVELSKFKHVAGTNIFENDYEVEGRLLDTIATPIGKMIVAPAMAYADDLSGTIYVTKSPVLSVVDSYTRQLAVSLKDEKATIIDLSLNDVNTQRADDIISTLIAIYNENWIKDKNQIAVSTSAFINERLGVIERELGNVDKNISTFKSKNLLPDVQAASSIYMTQSTKTNEQIMALNNQLYMTRYIRSYLIDGKNRYQLLPVNSGINNGNIESQIADYNTKMLQRNGLVANSSEQNPLVMDLDIALGAMRHAVITSIDNQIETLNTQIKSLQQSEEMTTSRIAANPTQAKYLLSVERQQKVKESLYLYLLQKREENELSQAFTAYNTRIITPPRGPSFPTSPKPKMILMVAIVMGLAVPFGIIFLLETLNTRIRGRKDLERLTIPFLGEIPMEGEVKRSIFGKKKMSESRGMVVKAGCRDIINEAFRVLRTNLEFMTTSSKDSNVIIVTSSNPGSGKSFLSMNVAMSLAIKNKRVLVIDGDMRHASSSTYVGSPKVGLSDYLSGRVSKVEDIVVSDKFNACLHVIPVGTIPPNPTELLFENRMAELIEKAREAYDYVLIDCPPIELVADTQILEKLADRTIFVVRAGLFEKNMLPELQSIYDMKKYKNMSMVLNGTEGGGSHRGYRYGYRYGYHYGYGSDYHYGSEEK